MKKLFLLFAFFMVLAVGCKNHSDDQIINDIFITDVDGVCVIDAEGGEVEVTVTTNIDYSVVIPYAAQSWLSVADTRAKTHIDSITFIVAVNEDLEERSANVKLVNAFGKTLQTVSFVQSAIAVSDPTYYTNEIWYTNGSTTEPTHPYDIDAFGSKILSNTYDIENDCWIITFDGKVTTIGECAFIWCYDLTSITIPRSVTTIGYWAFEGCSNLQSVTIGYGVTAIDDSAFGDCSSLTNVTIPNSVTTIGDGAFYNCSSMTSITLPDSVTTIGGSAFEGCSSLTSVKIPKSVTTIGLGAFRGCSSLAAFTGKFASEDSRCLIIDGALNSFAPAGLTKYTIPYSVTSIGNDVFYDCRNLISVTLPDRVTTIGTHAFYNCSSLTSVNIPNRVTTIGSHTFYNCSSLTSVSIPDGLTTIGYSAFASCSSLTSMTIPNSVTTIKLGAFCGCASLAEFNGKFASEDSRCLIIDGVLNAFAPAGISEYTLPNGVTAIGNYAFEYCSGLTSVTIPDSVSTIGDWAFAYCSSLKSVYCKATTPPTGNSYMFNNTAPNLQIYVPTESVNTYKSAPYWSSYANAIIGYNFE